MSDSHAPAATATSQNWYQAQANTLYTLAAIAALTFPGALMGALFCAGIWHLIREPVNRRVVIAGVAASTAILTHTLVVGWPWQLATSAITSGLPQVAPSVLIRSFVTEMLLGPLLLLVLQLASHFHRRTTLGQVADEHRRMTKRAKALRPGYKPGGGVSSSGDWNHPPGKIRLGVDASGRIFDLDIADVDRHVFIPGGSGAGKTTTLVRLAGGALANGYGVVIIDCKGVSLSVDAQALARRFRLPFFVIDPDDPASLGYDTCTGDPSHIANKLVGAFSFSAEADIYKQVALEVVPVIARALQLADKPVTLWQIYDALGQGGLHRLGRSVPDEQMQARLRTLGTGGGIGAAGYTGLQRRLGALLEGKFGNLFSQSPALNWATVTSRPSVTYFSLSATATGEDVELFGRVITQDLKQLCDLRLRQLRSGTQLPPLLVVYDEFAALREASQIVDLLLQARQARMPIVTATQFLPEEPSIRTPVLQAGTLICHQVVAKDADAIAAEIGTRKILETTAQVDFETGESEKGSVRSVEAYQIHPDDLKKLPIGKAAVYVKRTQRREIVQIHRDED